MLVLGIETATEWCGLALWNDHGPVSSRAFVNHMELSRRLVPAIRSLLADENLGLADVQGIGVSTGPGSFTGLRIGVATAKTICQVTGIPLLGVETMDSLALPYEPLARTGTRLAVTVAARRHHYYVRWYGDPDDDGDRTIHLLAREQLREHLALSTVPVLLLGDAPLKEGLTGTEMPILSGAHRPHALNIAYMAHGRFRRGEADDPMTLTPLYVGLSAAEERREAVSP